MGNKGTKTYWRSAGRILEVLGIGYMGAILILAYFKIVPMDLYQFCALESLGLGFIAIGLSFTGLDISLSSEERMKALTNLNYYEKMAMLEGYKSRYAIYTTDTIKRDLEKVCYDIEAITALYQWIDTEKIEKRNTSVIETATYAREKYPGTEYEDLITKLKETAEGDASENENI